MLGWVQMFTLAGQYVDCCQSIFLRNWWNTQSVSKLCVFIGWYPTLIQLDWQQQLLTYSLTYNLFVSKIIKTVQKVTNHPPPHQTMKDDWSRHIYNENFGWSRLFPSDLTVCFRCNLFPSQIKFSPLILSWQRRASIFWVKRQTWKDKKQKTNTCTLDRVF